MIDVIRIEIKPLKRYLALSPSFYKLLHIPHSVCVCVCVCVCVYVCMYVCMSPVSQNKQQLLF
jgi:hypothetical protein